MPTTMPITPEILCLVDMRSYMLSHLFTSGIPTKYEEALAGAQAPASRMIATCSIELADVSPHGKVAVRYNQHRCDCHSTLRE
jgi:hypothetical protein